MTPDRRTASSVRPGLVMTVEQVAEYLQLNRLTVYRYVREGKIPAARIGKLYRILKADVDGFLEAQKTAAPRRAGVSMPWEAQAPAPTSRPTPQEIYVGPNWRERMRERDATRMPTYPIEWVIRGLH